MLITCDNKGCLKATDAQYDNNTKNVICLACEKPITSISESMKRVLSTSGQIVRNDMKKSFIMGCMNCYANREVVLTKDENTVCAVCFNPITVHAAMRLALQETNTKLRHMTQNEEDTMQAKLHKKNNKKKKYSKNTKQ